MLRPYRQDESDLESEQTLLYVHQEPWQKELLKRYGNAMSAYQNVTNCKKLCI